MAKILVTGGGGYVGAHTVHYLLKHGRKPADLIVFDNLVHGHRDFVPEGVVFQQGDLLCKKDIEQVFLQHAIDGVLHFAAYAYVGESMVEPGRYFENNLLGGIHLLDAMVRFGCRRIVFSSSCAVYGNPHPTPISEQSALLPVNPYGESKKMFEKILAWYHRIYGLSVICLRYFNAAGADFGIGERHVPETHLIPLLIKAAHRGGRTVKLFGSDYDTPDGTCVRDFVHIADLARAHALALELLTKESVCEMVNLGTGQGHSVLQVCRLLQEITGLEVPISLGARRAGDPPVLVADTHKAAGWLNWKAEKNLMEILQSAWQWQQQEQECSPE